MALDELKYCCLQLQSNRVTDRKNGSELLCSLLDSPEIKAALDAQTTDAFNWTQVFHSACKFFFKEARRIEDEERNMPDGSQTVLSNRMNLKKGAAALPRLVLTKSSQKMPRVSAQRVMDFVMKILDKKRPYLLENFASETLQLIHYHLNHFPKYYMEIPANNWRELVKICMWLYKTEDIPTDTVTLLAVLEGIVKCSGKRNSLTYPSTRALQPLLNFLKRSLISPNLSSEYNLQSALLSLLLTFTKTVGSEWRRLVCQVSESTFGAVIAMWESKPSPRQNDLLQYLNEVMILHHPQKGSSEIHEGSEVVEDRVQWKRHLHHLYQLIVNHIEQLVNRGTSGEKKNYTITPLMVTLTARVYHKIFGEGDDYSVLEVEQVGDTQGYSRKRRRIEIGLGPVSTYLLTKGCYLPSFPWYLVLYELLTSHPAFFTSEQCCLLLDSLIEILDKPTHILIQPQVLRCLRGLAVQYKNTCFESCTIKEMRAKWMPVWEKAVGLAGCNYCSQSGFELLNTLMEIGLALPTLQTYLLYYEYSLEMTEASLSALHTLLSLVSLPVHFRIDIPLDSEENIQESRRVLLKLLLPIFHKDLGEFANTVLFSNTTLLAQVLLSLCLHDTASAKGGIEVMKNIQENAMTRQKFDEYCCDVENLCFVLSLTRPLPLLPTQGSGSLSDISSETLGSKMVLEHQEVVISRLDDFVQQLKLDSASGSAEWALPGVQVVELLVKLLQHIPDHRLEKMLEDMLKLVERSIVASLEKPESESELESESESKAKSESESESDCWSLLLPPIQALHHIYSVTAIAPRHYKNEARVHSEMVHRRLISLTPPGLFSVMLNTATSVLEESASTSQPEARFPTQSALSNSGNLDIDVMNKASVSDRSRPQKYENGTSSPSQEKIQAVLDLNDMKTWSVQYQCVSAGLGWLSCCLYPADASITPLQLNTAITFVHHHIDNSAMDKERTGVILKFVECMFEARYSEDIVHKGMNIMIALCDKYSSDPEVIQFAITTITALVHANSNYLSHDHKKSVVDMIDKFFSLLDKAVYGQEVIISLLTLIIEVAKVDPLGTWRSGAGSGKGVFDQLSYFFDIKSNRVRCVAALSVYHLLGGPGATSDPHQDMAFQNLYEASLQALNRTKNTQGTVLGEVSREEYCGGESSLLLMLGVMVVNSQHLHYRAFVTLCRLIPDQHIDQVLVARLYSRIAESMKSSLDKMMQKKLAYLVTQWLRHDYAITDFPPALLSCPSSASFLSKHCSILIPVLLENNHSCAFESMACTLNVDVKHFLADNFHTIMAQILPYLAVDDTGTDSVPRAKIDLAREHYGMMEKELGIEQIRKLMKTCMGSIIALLVQLAHNPEGMVAEELVLNPIPQHFPPPVIRTTLMFISRIFNKNQPLFMTLAGDCCDQLPVVLECCGKNLCMSGTPLAAQKALTSLEIVVEALLPGLAQHNCRSTPATLRWLTHTLTTHLKSITTFAPHLSDYYLQLLSRVCTFALVNSSVHFAPLITLVFGRLVPLCRRGSEVSDKCVEILQNIMDSQHPDIQMRLSDLPPLPDQEEFVSLNELRVTHRQLVQEWQGNLTLEEEVEAFLAFKPDQVHTQGLTHLLKMLEKQRNQVNRLYRWRGVGQESLGHRLVHFLVNLASSNRKKVALEACKCLGEVGPASFGTTVFSIGGPSHYSDSASDPESQIALTVIRELNKYLTDDDVNVVVAASGVLQKLLRTVVGFGVVSLLPLLTQQYLCILSPPSKPKTTMPVLEALDAEGYKAEVGNDDVWLFGGGEYQSWVTGLATAVIRAGCGSCIISHLLPVCAVKAEFSALVLPLVIHAALKTDQIGRRDVLSQQFSSFFQHHVQVTKPGAEGSQRGKEMVISKAAIQVLLNVIDYLRTQMPHRNVLGGKVTPLERNRWLNLNYLHVAQAAHYCGAQLSALLFLHLHCEVMQTAIDNNDVDSRRDPLLTQISSHPDITTYTTLLLQVYCSLDDSMGVDGCVGSSIFTDIQARALQYHHRRQWFPALSIRDATSDVAGVVQELRSLGLFRFLSVYLNDLMLSKSQEVTEGQWETTWRLSKWDDTPFEDQMVEEEALWDEGEGFHSSLFKALNSLRHRNQSSMHHHILCARRRIISRLKLNRVESSSSIYPILSELQMLSEIEVAAECVSCLSNPVELSTFVKNLGDRWIRQEHGIEQQYHEPIMAAQVSALKAITAECVAQDLDALLHDVLLSKSKLGREGDVLAGFECYWTVMEAHQLSRCLPMSASWLTSLEEARVAKKYDDALMAVQPLHSIVDYFQQEGTVEHDYQQLLCEALTMYGSLLIDSISSTPEEAIRDYFSVAVSMLEGNSDSGQSYVLEETYHQLATYTDQLYHQVLRHLEGNTIQAKRLYVEQFKKEIARVEGLIQECTDEAEKSEFMRKLVVLNRNLKNECNILAEVEQELEDYLAEALKNYLKCLRASSKYHHDVYRVVALWVQNIGLSRINIMMGEYIEQIKSHQFVPVLYQLVARLSCQRDQNPKFHTALSRLLELVSVDHPHHSLPVLMAQAHAHTNHHITTGMDEKMKVSEEDRVRAAQALVMRLKKTSIGEHVQEFEKVSLAYLSLANWADSIDTKHQPGQRVQIDPEQPLMRLSNLCYTTALTRPLQIQPSCCYNSPPIISWGNLCTFVGGNNAPKQLTVKTSDGLQLFELLKGQDDLRQDAVMEQVFGIVNQLLAQNRNTRERGLSVRTYQVVPLSQTSGLIQWCSNTQSFGAYLMGSDKKSGAHKLYNPSDYSPYACYRKMFEVKDAPWEQRYEVFKDIIRHFHPVFRHFFLEQYPSVQEWQRRRVAYTRSVATTSMVGYVLGLGDRHPENILIDRSTAELIHIDLGIAFELGKVLPTPETVPFRLTQDMVDGLGVLGIAGSLQGESEVTLRVLRECREVLLTVVEALRHDPLYHWTLSPQQVARLQNIDKEYAVVMAPTVSMAERVLEQVRLKLEGHVDGLLRTVTQQVEILLQEAVDLTNLSRIFPGWGPFV